MSRAWAAAAYLPVPFWALVAVLVAPDSRLVRHHAWQGGVWTLVWVVVMAALAPVAATGQAGAFVAGTSLLVALVGLLTGAASALRGRYLRLRPVWDLLAYAKGSPKRTA